FTRCSSCTGVSAIGRHQYLEIGGNLLLFGDSLLLLRPVVLMRFCPREPPHWNVVRGGLDRRRACLPGACSLAQLAGRAEHGARFSPDDGVSLCDLVPQRSRPQRRGASCHGTASPDPREPTLELYRRCLCQG